MANNVTIEDIDGLETIANAFRDRSKELSVRNSEVRVSASSHSFWVTIEGSKRINVQELNRYIGDVGDVKEVISRGNDGLEIKIC